MKFVHIIAAALLLATPALAADKRVFRIDSLLATQKGGAITLQAKGAVQTGGWSKPRLHLMRNDGHVLTVEFLATPEGEIRRVRITGQDQSKLDFTFSNEQLNVPVAQSLFTFHPPPGVQIVEAGQ